MVTLDIVTDMLHVPKIAHPDYSGCERLKTVSNDELIFAFCEHPSNWTMSNDVLLVRPLLKVLGFLTWL